MKGHTNPPPRVGYELRWLRRLPWLRRLRRLLWLRWLRWLRWLCWLCWLRRLPCLQWRPVGYTGSAGSAGKTRIDGGATLTMYGDNEDMEATVSVGATVFVLLVFFLPSPLMVEKITCK